LGENTLQEIEDLVRVRLLGAARHDQENTALAFGKNIVIVAAGRKVSRCDGHTHAFTDLLPAQIHSSSHGACGGSVLPVTKVNVCSSSAVSSSPNAGNKQRPHDCKALAANELPEPVLAF
jgi:hypothetical protein